MIYEHFNLEDILYLTGRIATMKMIYGELREITRESLLLSFLIGKGKYHAILQEPEKQKESPFCAKDN